MGLIDGLEGAELNASEFGVGESGGRAEFGVGRGVAGFGAVCP